MVLPISREAAIDTGDDEVAAGHADAAGDEDGFAAEAVDVQHGWDGGEELHHADDTCGEEGAGVSGQLETLEDEGGYWVRGLAEL